MNKNGSSRIWWILGVALLVLLVVLWSSLFTEEGISKTKGSLFGCEGKGGKCVSESTCVEDGGTVNSDFECKESREGAELVCCMEV